MRVTHAPGPWRVCPMAMYVLCEEYMVVDMKDDRDDSNADGVMVTRMRGWGHLQYKGQDVGQAIQRANARLIAAAPELLATLERMSRLILSVDLDRTSPSQWGSAIKGAQNMAQAAQGVIAKATGEEAS